MDFYGYEFIRESDLQHYGLKGMHWGTRRWQNPDGTFNAAGYQRYFGRGTGEDYHPVGRSSSGGQSSGASRSSGNLGGTKRSFDKEKAKKIAKGVAIGAAVVGGTVLVAYGAKHLKDSDVLGKMREGRLASAKAFEKYKTEKLQIKLEGKEMRANIRDNFKNGMAALKVDPQGKLDRSLFEKGGTLNSALANDSKGLKNYIKGLSPDEVNALNSGKTGGNIQAARNLAKDLFGEEAHLRNVIENPDKFTDSDCRQAIWNVNESRKLISENLGTKPNLIDENWRTTKIVSDIANNGTGAHASEAIGNAVGKATTKTLQTTGKVAKKAYEAATSEQAKQTYKNVAKTAGETAKKAYKAATSEQAKESYKKAAQATGQVAKKAYKAATSEQTKNAVKKTATATKNGVKTAASITKSTIEVAKLASQHPQETKAAVDYTKQLLQNMQGISAANARNGQAVSKSNATEQYNAQTLARQYRRDHPNTKLSNREIVRNMGYGL